MANYVLSRNERIFIAKQPEFGTAVAPVATDAVRHIKARLKPEVSTLRRRDKTGSRQGILGKKGRQSGSWSIEASLVHGADADDLPDYDALYEAAFGKPGTVNAGSSVVYGIHASAIRYFTMLQYLGDAGTPNHQMAWGCIVRRLTFQLGQDVAEFSAEGDCGWVQGSKSWAGASAIERGNLATFPVEPASPVTLGDLIEGFIGSVIIGGEGIADIISANITVDFATETVKNTFGSRTPTGAQGGVRNVSIGMSVHCSDDAALETLREAGESKEPLNAQIMLGETPGAIAKFDIKGIQLESPDLDDGSHRMAVNFPDSPAFGTLGSDDEFALTFL